MGTEYCLFRILAMVCCFYKKMKSQKHLSECRLSTPRLPSKQSKINIAISKLYLHRLSVFLTQQLRKHAQLYFVPWISFLHVAEVANNSHCRLITLSAFLNVFKEMVLKGNKRGK